MRSDKCHFLSESNCPNTCHFRGVPELPNMYPVKNRAGSIGRGAGFSTVVYNSGEAQLLGEAEVQPEGGALSTRDHVGLRKVL